MGHSPLHRMQVKSVTDCARACEGEVRAKARAEKRRGREISSEGDGVRETDTRDARDGMQKRRDEGETKAIVGKGTERRGKKKTREK